jgi:hypothetical protein
MAPGIAGDGSGCSVLVTFTRMKEVEQGNVLSSALPKQREKGEEWRGAWVRQPRGLVMSAWAEVACSIGAAAWQQGSEWHSRSGVRARGE